MRARRLAAVSVWIAGFFLAAGSPAQTRPATTMQEVDAWRSELSNWGRWGEDDRLGALNLVTPAKRKAAAALVREGVSISLAHDMMTETAADAPEPLVHTMVASGAADNPSNYAMDRYDVAFHGFAQTHLDALCHVFHDGRMYNGVDRATATAEGCSELDVVQLRDGIFTRGVLVDIAWLRGVDWLEPGTAIYPEELDAWEARTGVHIEPGDAILLRTGRWARRAAKGAWGPALGAAGLHASCAKWLRARDVALLASDGGSDVVPSGVAGAAGLFLPIHELAIAAMGVPLIDNADLERLSQEAQARGRWDFLLTLAPMRVVGGTGSPINPIATF